MTTNVLNFTQTLKTETCYQCHMVFAAPEAFMDARVKDKARFYCPNGHGQHYTGESDAAKMKRLQEAKDLADRACQLAEDAAAKAQKKLRLQMKRANAGICPHCTRPFSNMARHIACKHPGAVKP